MRAKNQLHDKHKSQLVLFMFIQRMWIVLFKVACASAYRNLVEPFTEPPNATQQTTNSEYNVELSRCVSNKMMDSIKMYGPAHVLRTRTSYRPDSDCVYGQWKTFYSCAYFTRNAKRDTHRKSFSFYFQSRHCHTFWAMCSPVARTG